MGAPPSRSRLIVPWVGLVLAATVAAALALWPRVAPDPALETADALGAWIAAHPDRASLWVWDLDTGETLARAAGDRARPVAGLTALLLAAEYARQADAGLDTTYRVSGSALERRVLPGVEPAHAGTDALALPALVRTAVQGHRPAADELLRIVGRRDAEAISARLGLPDLDAPLPVGGLQLAWSPAQWAGGTTPAEQAERFARLPRAAQRDSAFARDRSFQSSAAYRSEEMARLERHGLGLTEAETHTVAARSFPRGTARDYADLLARAFRGTLLSPSVSARVLRSLSADTLRVAAGAGSGLASAAVLDLAQRRGAVVLVEGLPVGADAQPAHARAAVELAARWMRRPEGAFALQDR